jgi:hypothetical protein
MPRFMQKGTTKFYWVLTLSSTTSPSAAQINAGTNMTAAIAEVNGFMFANNPITTPDMASTFVSSIPGEDTADASSLVFYENKGTGTNPILTALVKGTAGYVVIFPWGTAGANPAAADVADVWPAQVASKSRGYSAGNEASKVTVVFTMTAEPSLEKTLAA